MGALASGEILLFEDFRLDRRGLYRRDGRGVFVPVAIGSRAFDLLRVLVAADGDLVAKDEIMAAVWPGIVVEDSNLTVQISTLRRILDRGRAEGSCIQTIAGRGYRFATPVTRHAAEAGSGSAAVPDARERSPPGLHAPQAQPQRRLITVLSCGIVGSTPPANGRDPEAALAQMAALHTASTKVIDRWGGFVAKFHGDGLVAYFGYPQADEDDAERAVRAGIALIDAIGQLAAPDCLRAHIGVSTGVVVVGDLIGEGEAQDRGIVGEAPNLAAILRTLAEPNAIVIADSTRDQVGALFEVADLGPQQLAGFGAPQRAWRILGESREPSRFQALRSGNTPLIGREEEIELLRRRWAQAKAGAGRVVLISGEPGIGKSRLAEAFREYVMDEPHARLRYFCSPHQQDSALYPIIGQLERAAGFEGCDTAEAKLEKLHALVSATTPAEGDVPLLAELLSVPLSGRYPALDLTPQRKKEKTLEALLRQLQGLAQQRPVLMVFEDLHWADPTSRELFDLVVEQVEGLPALLIATFRPEFQPPWTGQPQVTTWSLRRLGSDESGELVRGMVGNIAALPSAVVDEIVKRSDGVPLFLEELTKAVIEIAAAGRGSASAVPATLHASLIARLDHLGPTAREIAQVGAAIGRDFSYELLAVAAERSEAELPAALGQLVDAGLVFQRGVAPQAHFLFKHALVQDTAYGMLLRGPRRALHARIAGALEQRFPSVAETQPQILAHHFTEAGNLENAVAYWRRAGQQSTAKGALVEAIAQLRRGLRLVIELPESRERKQQELDLEVALALTLMALRGYAHPEVVEALGRARSLVVETKAEGTIPHFSVLQGLSVAYYNLGKPTAALEQAKESLSLAQSQTEPELLSMGHRRVGVTLLTVGDYSAALSHLERAVECYAPEKDRKLAFQSGDTRVATLCAWAWALWHRGYADQASKAADETLRLARQSVLNHHYNLAYALFINSLTAISARWAAEAEELASEVIAIASEHGLAHFLGRGLIVQGWATAQRRQSGVAVCQIREGLAAMQATGSQAYEPIFLGLLAEALALTGEIEEGLAVIADALAKTEASGAKGNDAELHRLRGDLIHRLPSPDWPEVEVCFRTALAIAGEQGTRGFELRAASSLARLWREQGRRDEARDLLAPVCGWFTEGFNTPDLKEAKALLDELA